MAQTSQASGLTPQQWDDKFYVESIQENRFVREMGTTENAIIQLKETLTGKKGDRVTFALVNRLKGAGITGTQFLTGNEEALVSRSMDVVTVLRGQAVQVPMQAEQYSAISLRDAAKTALKTWANEDTRDRIIEAMASIDGVAYGSASEAQKDAWLANNSDRVLFGKVVSNNQSNDHSASLAEIDATNDKLTTDAISLMKRLALEAQPRIRPHMSKDGGREYYCAYVHTRAFRDLQADATLRTSQQSVSLIKQNEKLFHGDDLLWDGVIIKRLEDIPILSGVGASSIDVAPVFFCGAQAVAYGVCKRWYTKEELTNYQHNQGVGIFAFDGFEKMRFGTGATDTDTPKDHGMVTGYFAAAADS